MSSYVYSRTYIKDTEMSRLECTLRGEFNSISWYRETEGYTATGDASTLNYYNTVTIVTPQVTAEGWFSDYSTSYNIYCTIHTPYGTYSSETKNYEWDADNSTRTLTFTIDNVIGEWDYFQIWANQQTYSTSDYGRYLRWFNNANGTVTVTYVTKEDSPITTFIGSDSGEWMSGNTYVYKTSNPKIYIYPEGAMTSNNSQNCIANCSSTYSNDYPAWRAFDKTNSGYCWAGSRSDTTAPWLQLTYPKALYNISIFMANRSGTTDNGPINGIIYGSNDDGTTLTQIGSFTGRESAAEKYSIIQCNNSATAYNTIRIVTSRFGSGTGDCGIGEVFISGTDIGNSGAWVAAKPLIWKTTGAKTYTYPQEQAGLTAWESQNCIALASTELHSTTYPAWKAFNRATGSNDLWYSSGDSNPWLQLTMPKPLYNIQVELYNSFVNNHPGAKSGIIYGSNDFGTTLTEIGNFTNRTTSIAGSSIIDCTTNTKNNAYNTIRLVITEWADINGNSSAFSLGGGVGAMYITGKHIGENGGWTSLTEEDRQIINIYPKGAMNTNISQDCIVSASSIYQSSAYTYHGWKAFNKNFTSEVQSWAALASDASPWLQIILPKPLKNISFFMLNNTAQSSNDIAPEVGSIQGTNYNGENLGNFTTLYTFSNRVGTASCSTTYCLNNTTPYQVIKLNITPQTIPRSGFVVGEILILGTD